MRQLLPEPIEIDPVEAHAATSRPAPNGRPWVALNMVSSADGATAHAGLSGGLGGDDDKVVFRAIRAIADVILVAAGTVRAERYGPPRTSPELQAARLARGQSPYPRLAIISGSLDLDEGSELFTQAPEPPLVFTVESAPEERVSTLSAVAEVHAMGATRVDVGAAVSLLATLGAHTVVVEGGPSLNGALIAAGLVDELNLTLSPRLLAGESARVAHGAEEVCEEMDLSHLWTAGGFLFARYTKA